MEIATPARSSPFPKLTFDHKLIIAKHLVSTNGDDKRKTPNHLNGEDESLNCDLKDDANYESGAKSSNVTCGIVISNAIDKTPNTIRVGDKPIIAVQQQQQRQDDMPTKMSENQNPHHLNHHLQLQPNYDNLNSMVTLPMIIRVNDGDMCNNINRDNTLTATTTTSISTNHNNNKLSYVNAHKSLDRIKTIPTSVTVHGNDELSLKSNQLLNCNKSDLRTNHDYNENCKNDTNCNGGSTFNNSEGLVTSSAINNGTNFKVPTELTVNINNNKNNSSNNRSSPTSPSIPYRKQSVFVAPAGLNWIIHKNRNNQQQPLQPPPPPAQHQQIPVKHNRIDSSGVSTPTSPPSTTFSSSPSPIPSTLSFNSPSSIPSTPTTTPPVATTIVTTTTTSSSIGINGETLNSINSCFSSSNVNCNSNSANNSSPFIRKNSTSLAPKANAQEIEQHISKIISENAAIVETLDPLWSKRYLSRHSVSSLPSASTSSSSSSFSSSYPATLTGTTVTTNNLPSRRYSEIVVDPNHASGSKLQSALLGRVLTTCSPTSGTTVVSPSNVPHLAHHHQQQQQQQQQHHSLVNPNGPTKKFSEPIYPSVIINMKQQVNSLSKPGGSLGINDQTGLRPSLVRNLLTSAKSPSIKVIPVPTSCSSSFSSSSTTTIVDNPANVNPDNPEGSIIKDLLLKARDACESSNERRNSRVVNQLPSIPPPIQEELSMLVYVCTLCTICFRNKETLEAHQLHYCKANETQSTINERSPNQLQLLNDHVQRKISVMESNFLQQQLTKPVQSSTSNPKSSNIFAQPQLINQHLKQQHQQQHHYQSSSSSPLNQTTQQQQQQAPSVGNILKQQLLAPSAGPPLKKRKTSEPLLTKSHLHRFSHPHHPLNPHYSSQSQYHTDIINSHSVRKTSVVQSPSSKLLVVPKNKSSTKETLIESDCLNSNLSSTSTSTSTSTTTTTTINDNHVISVISEPITFSSTTNTIAFSSSSNHSHSFSNHQSSLDRLSSSLLSSFSSSSASATSSLTNCQQKTITLDILPDYYPHLKCPKTKVTLSGPIVFPVLRKILTENKENIEFQASPESLQSSPSTSSTLTSPSSSTLVSTTVNPSGHPNTDTINNNNNTYLVYKQIPSIPEFDEDSMVEEKVDEVDKDDRMKFKVEHDDGEPIKCDHNLNNLPDNKVAHQEVPPSANQEGQDKVDGHLNVNNSVDDVKRLTGVNYKSTSENCDTKLNNITNNSNINNGLTINNRPTTLTLRKNYPSSTGLTTTTTETTETIIMGVDNKLIGSTLVSPDTPRPKRKCMQLYIKGQTYTYLGLKMSTRSTYCCIYRPQPMYVPQEASSKLSMYSNWKINSPHHDIFKLMSPAELLHAYDTRQWYFKPNGISITFAPSLESKKSLADSFILTPSSYWTIKKQPEEKAAIKRELIELKRKGIEDLTDTLMDNNNNHSARSVYLTASGGGGGSRKTSEDRLSTMSGFDSDSNDPNQPKRVKIFEGGFKSNEDYTYVRGRGRGKYVCEECGIRCKKPSMLKKHIRTHTDLRPYSCRHCAFAFKTKGNLTKHMKSKAHHKKCVELGIIPVPITIDESQIDCEALAKQEALERSYSGGHLASDDDENDPDDEDGCEEEEDDGSDDEGVPIPIITSSGMLTDHVKMDIDELGAVGGVVMGGVGLIGSEERKDHREHRKSIIVANEMDEQEVARSLLVLSGSGEWSVQGGGNPTAAAVAAAMASASGVQVASNCLEAKYNCDNPLASSPSNKHHYQHITDCTPSDLRKMSTSSSSSSSLTLNKSLLDDRLSLPSTSTSSLSSASSHSSTGPTHVNGAHFVNHWSSNIQNSFSRQRSFSFNDGLIRRNPLMIHNNLDSNLRRFEKQSQQQPLDLNNLATVNNSNANNPINGHINGGLINNDNKTDGQMFEHISTDDSNDSEVEDHFQRRYSMSVIQDRVEPMCFNYDRPIDLSRRPNEDNPIAGPSRYDQPQPGRRNTLSTPSSQPMRHLSRAELAAAINGSAAASFGIGTREDGKSVCLKCNKSFPKLSQLRLHVAVHYFERPFRCDSCSVSFRTKGHLQKHEKSTSHSDKVKINLAFGAATTDNPRPFKCDDCVVAFRIHGHLAKHLRSKNHIMKLECAGKLPCGMYADMERFGINLNVIATADCESSLISLQRLAEQMYFKNGEINVSWLRQTTLTTNANVTANTNAATTTRTITTTTTATIPTQYPTITNSTTTTTCPIPTTTSTTAIATVNNSTIYYHNLNLANCNNKKMDVDEDNNHINGTNCNNNNNTITIDNNIGDNNNNIVNDNNNNHYAYHNHSGHMSNMITVNSSQASSSPSPSTTTTTTPPLAQPSISSLPTNSSSPSSTTLSTTTTSSTTNITSIRSNTCNYCKQVFKSAKFLQVHLYCDHQQQRSSSPSPTTEPNPQPQPPQQPPPPQLPPSLPSHTPQSHSSSTPLQLQTQPQPQSIQIHPPPHYHLQHQQQFHHELHQQHLQHLQQLQQLQQQMHPHHHLNHHQQQQRSETPSNGDDI